MMGCIGFDFIKHGLTLDEPGECHIHVQQEHNVSDNDRERVQYFTKVQFDEHWTLILTKIFSTHTLMERLKNLIDLSGNQFTLNSNAGCVFFLNISSLCNSVAQKNWKLYLLSFFLSLFLYANNFLAVSLKPLDRFYASPSEWKF